MVRKNKIYTIFVSVWIVVIFFIGGCVVCVTQKQAWKSQNDIWEYKLKLNPNQVREYHSTEKQDSIAKAWQIKQAEKVLKEIRK